MTHSIHVTSAEDAAILNGLIEAQRLGLSRSETLTRLGVSAERVELVVEGLRAHLPQLPPEAPVSAIDAKTAARRAAMDRGRQKAIAAHKKRAAERAAAAAAAAEKVPAKSSPPAPAAAKTRPAPLAKAAPTAAPTMPSAAPVRRVHRTQAQQATRKPSRQQIHMPAAARIPELRRLMEENKDARTIAGLMGIGTARIYQLARGAGIPFGGKPAG